MSQNVNVNLTPGGYPKEFHVSQYDVGRQLVANIVDSTGAYSIPSGATVVLVGTKPSGFGFTLNGTVSGSTVTFSTTATVTAEYGRIPCELRITSGDTVLGTANLMLIVEESPHREGVIDGNSETVIPELTILVERVEAAASNVLDMQVEADTLPAGSSATYSYDEETNTATFGIPQGEAGAGAAGVVASAYSASSTYAVGDYVIHNSSLYRCTTAITTAEAFTAAHWTQVLLGDDVSDLKSDLAQLTAVTTTLVDGYISSTDGQLKPATSDAQKSSDYIEVSNGFIIDIDIAYESAKYRSASIYGYDAGKKYIGLIARVEGGAYKQFTVSGTITNEAVCYIRFNFNTYSATYTCDVNIYPNVKDNVLALQHEIKELPMSCLNLRDTIAWQKGDISSGSIVASTTRIVTTDIICKPYDIVLPFNADVFYMMWTYDDVQGSNPVWAGYVNMYKYAIYRIPYIIPAGTCFRLIIRYTDTTISEADIRDAEIYKLVEMYEYGSYATVSKSLRSTTIMSIAHQGMGTNPDDKGQSKMSALIRARNFGFSHIETDIQWSSDNVPVCCHDATFTDTNTSNTITIASHTLAELKTYGYYGETILSLEEVISFCKDNGMGLVIDHGYFFTSTQWNIAFALVNKYAMQDYVIWLVTTGTATASYPNEWYSKANIAILSDTNDLTSDIAYAKSAKTANNNVYIDVNANVMTATILANAITSLGADIKLIIWTIDRTDWLASFKPYVAGITSNTINCGLA